MKLILSKHELFILKPKYTADYEYQFYKSYITLTECTSIGNFGNLYGFEI